MPPGRTPRRWQFSLGQVMGAVGVAAFDSLVMMHGALIWDRKGVVFLRNYVANTIWPTLAVLVTAFYLWWVVRKRD